MSKTSNSGYKKCKKEGVLSYKGELVLKIYQQSNKLTNNQYLFVETTLWLRLEVVKRVLQLLKTYLNGSKILAGYKLKYNKSKMKVKNFKSKVKISTIQKRIRRNNLFLWQTQTDKTQKKDFSRLNRIPFLNSVLASIRTLKCQCLKLKSTQKWLTVKFRTKKFVCKSIDTDLKEVKLLGQKIFLKLRLILAIRIVRLKM